MGDSGGDGPHFEWGARMGATLIGSMTKPSLKGYCDERNIKINHFFGETYPSQGPKLPGKEMTYNFLDISRLIQSAIRP